MVADSSFLTTSLYNVVRKLIVFEANFLCIYKYTYTFCRQEHIELNDTSKLRATFQNHSVNPE